MEWSVTSTVSPGVNPTPKIVTDPPAVTEPAEAVAPGSTTRAGHVTSDRPAETGATVPMSPYAGRPRPSAPWAVARVHWPRSASIPASKAPWS